MNKKGGIMKKLLLFSLILAGCGPLMSKNGYNGVPGTSCTAQTVIGGVNIICGDNPPVFLANGSTGSTGPQGPQGNSCSVTTLSPSHDNPTGGAKIDCGSTSAIVINGAAGGAGAAYTIVGSIDPCGPSGGFDEVFLRMASGQLVALFTDSSSALTSRLAFIRDGVNLQTTDGQHCSFNLTTNSSGVRVINYTSSVVAGTPTFEQWQTY